MALKVLIILVLDLYIGGMNVSVANLTGDLRSNATLPWTSTPKTEQRETKIADFRTPEESMFHTRVATQLQDVGRVIGHGLMRGLLNPITKQIQVRVREQWKITSTTPKTPEVLMPMPIQPIPKRPEPPDDGQQHVNKSIDLNENITKHNTINTTTRRKDTFVTGRKDNLIEEPVLHVVTPPQDIKHVDELLAGLLLPAPKLISIKEEWHTLPPPEVAGVIKGLLIPIPGIAITISPNPPAVLQSETNNETMNATTERNNTLVESSNFTRDVINSTKDMFIDNSFISVNGKSYTVAYGEHMQTFGTRMHAHPVYEYAYPIVIGISLITMFFLVFVLSVKLKTSTLEMSKASCVLLIAVASTDILTMVFSVTEIGFMFSETRKNNNTMPFDSCRTMLILERLSAIPHVASTWFTVILAFQRYLCVAKPFSAGNYITVKSSLICILCVSALSIAIHICRFNDKTFEQISVIHQKQNTTIHTCKDVYAKWVKDPTLYESVFAWTRIGLAQFIPSILMVIFVTSMIILMRKMTMRSMHMQTGDSKMYSERRQLSFFVAAIACIVFTVEMASGIFLSFNAWEITSGQKIFSYDSLRSASIAFDLILYVSYFTIFLIYCLMSEEIRNKILSLCFKMKLQDKNLHTHSGSGLPPSSDSSKQSTSQTYTTSVSGST